jgi:hypothetical protein
LKNTATGLARDLKTNPAGEYVAAAVPPNCPPLAAATKGIALFNCAAYTQTQGLTFGNSGRNRLNNPHRTNLDMSVFKVFKPKENVQVQFRAEAFNVFNTPSGTA